MALNFAQSFTNQTTLSLPAATHGLGHAALRVQVWDAGMPRQRLVPGSLRVDPSTFAITVAFLQPQSGLLVAQGAMPPSGALGNKSFAFTVAAGGAATVTGTQHGYGTAALLVDVYDASSPRVWLPEVVLSIHPTTFDITARFLQAQSGLLVVSAAADVGTPNVSLPVTITAGGTLTIPGTSHSLGTANLGPQLYDSQGYEMVPGQLTVDANTYGLTVSTVQAFTGTLVLNGSSAPLVVPTGPRMIIASGGTLLLGGASMSQTGTALELTTGYYSFTFVDETQQGVDASVLTSLTLTYYDTASGQVINGRFHQNVLNANQGLLTTVAGPPLVTTFLFEFLPADAAILDQNQPSESRTMLFQWTWAGGQRAGARTVSFNVTNLNFVP